MRQYLEIVEQILENEKMEQIPEIIRVEVSDEMEAKEKMKSLKDKIRNGKCFLHTHYHYADSKLNKPCEMKELEDSVD